MKVKDYEAVCLEFAEDTRNWGAVDPYKFYSTKANGWGWYESCDNAEGGLSIKWAFHKTAEEIKAEAAQQFVDELVTLIRCTAENCNDTDDAEMLYSDLEYFK